MVDLLIPSPAKVEDLRNFYARMRDGLIKDLMRFSGQGFSEMGAIELTHLVTARIQAMNDRAKTWAAKAVPAAYSAGRARARTSLEILGRKAGQDRHARHDRRTLDLAANLYAGLQTANGTIKQTAANFILAARQGAKAMEKITAGRIQQFDAEDADELAPMFEAEAAAALTEGLTIQQLSKKIKDMLFDRLEGGDFITINGRNFAIDSYAEMVARTSLREAQTEAVKETCQEYENDLVMFSKHEDPCAEFCKPREGMIFSISGEDPEYPPLTPEDEPPLHPNCEHNLNPTSREAIDATAAWGE